jgi:hypothetical protein
MKIDVTMTESSQEFVTRFGQGVQGGGVAVETDPTVPAWAKEATKPTYTAAEVGADPVGSADGALKAAKEYADKMVVQSDWNETDENSNSFIKNKPIQTVAKTKTIKWDGNTDGKVIFEVFGPRKSFVKIGDYIPADKITEMLCSTFDWSGAFVSEVPFEAEDSKVEEKYWLKNDDSFSAVGIAEPCTIPYDYDTWPGPMGQFEQAMTFSEPGIYVLLWDSRPGDGYLTYISAISYAAETTTLDPALFPDTIATKEYVDSAIGSKTTEEWTFTLEDGSTVTKTVVIG